MHIRKSLESLARTTEHRYTLPFDPTEHADLLFGVGSATSAGPCLPAGSIHPSPETLEKDCGGYSRNQPIIGLGHAFISGAGGVKCYGNFLISPTLGEIELDHARRARFAKNGTERARCYEYSTELDNGIEIHTTPAHHSAMHRFTFPDGADGALMLDIAHKLDVDACMKEGFVTVSREKKLIYGGGLCTGNWNRFDWNMYFALRYDADESEVGAFVGDDIHALADDVSTVYAKELRRFGIYLKFRGERGKALAVKVKIAISFVSAERAIELLDSEIADFDYDAVKESARSKWRDMLGAIEIHSGDKALLRRFYTAMYHLNVQPRDRTADHGRWDDFHTVWDTWKTAFPLYALIYPDKLGAIVDSFIDRALDNRESGCGVVIADEFSTNHEFLAGQGGNDVDNVIADAYLKGVELKKHDWETAYEVLKMSAENMRSPEYINRGFATSNAKTVTGLDYTIRFKSAAATMGFAFNDKAIAAVARELGTPEECERYERRSANFLNVWNRECESEGFYSFPQSPREDGSFDSGFDAHGGYNKHFYEATGWDASYINYNDLDRLIEVQGGAETFTERLLWACTHSVNYYNDDEGAEGYLNFTNEPSFHIPWLFCAEQIRRPDLAAEVIDTVIKRFTREDDYPGDEDNGGMSAYYIFLMCGLFPYSTTERYYLHGTRLERAVIHLGCGRDLVITGDNVGDGNIYVKSASFNGTPLTECYINHRDLLSGGELHFVMADAPTNWGR